LSLFDACLAAAGWAAGVAKIAPNIGFMDRGTTPALLAAAVRTRSDTLDCKATPARALMHLRATPGCDARPSCTLGRPEPLRALVPPPELLLGHGQPQQIVPEPRAGGLEAELAGAVVASLEQHTGLHSLAGGAKEGIHVGEEGGEIAGEPVVVGDVRAGPGVERAQLIHAPGQV